MTMKHITLGSRGLEPENRIAVIIQSASFVSKPGRTAEQEGGAQGSGLNTAWGLPLGPAVLAPAVGDQTPPLACSLPLCAPGSALLAKYLCSEDCPEVKVRSGQVSSSPGSQPQQELPWEELRPRGKAQKWSSLKQEAWVPALAPPPLRPRMCCLWTSVSSAVRSVHPRDGS